MTSEFNKEHIPYRCQDCNSEGYVFVDDPEASYFVICKSCGWQTSYVWCPKCGMGSEFVKDLSGHPSDWVCPDCKTKYQLPNEFYEKPISLYLEEDLPDDVRLHLFPPRNKYLLQIANFSKRLFAFISFVGMTVSVGLHLILVVKGIRYKEVEFIVFFPFALMVPLIYHSLVAHFRHFTWHGKMAPIVIILYGLWYLFTSPPGALNQLPADVRKVAEYHQAIFAQSFIMSGYTLACYYWSYINREHTKNNTT